MKLRITGQDFIDAVGFPPINDDLERVNCLEAGHIGHSNCGWCYKCNKPIFLCGHTKGLRL